MARSEENQSSAISLALTVVMMAGILVLVISAAQPVQAQTYTVLHRFNGSDGANPTSTLIVDRAGNVYGTTQYGGTHEQGIVFQMKRAGSGFIFNPIHEFHWNGSGGDGFYPLDNGGLTIAADGSLYGTTENGGILGCDGESTCGVVFRLQPPPTACTSALCPWRESIVYEFNPQSGPEFPISNVVFDHAGNLYGTTEYSSVFELSPSGGSWIASDYNAGYTFTSGVVVDSAGNLYGATPYVDGHGIIYELTPAPSGWTETVLYTFTNGSDGENPLGGLVFDSAGNLYGSTSSGGSGTGGTLFELSPSGSGWTLQTLCSFAGFAPGSGPQSALTMDAAGNLYGTTYGDGAFGDGMVFKASRSGNSWTCTDLFDFNGDLGLFPIGGVAVDAHGNIFGTASQTESNRNGTVWEITP